MAGIELEYTADAATASSSDSARPSIIPADQVFKAIGQTFVGETLNGSGPAIAMENGRIKVDAEGRTSMAKVWAGGDCVLAATT